VPMPTMTATNRNNSVPTLRTFGGLTLPGSDLTRPKPLLLLVYLALEGPTDRDRLARLFFAATSDPRDALSTTLRRLRGVVVTASADDARLTTQVATDALMFEERALRRDAPAALDYYRGAFLQGLDLAVGIELEEWILAKREAFAALARDLHVSLARGELSRRRQVSAWKHLRAAHAISSTFELEPRSDHAMLAGVAAGLPPSQRFGGGHASRSPAAAGASLTARRDRATRSRDSGIRSSRLDRDRPSEQVRRSSHRGEQR
jgi:hypothetical protein